jgi:hypothetical protein
MDPVGGGFRLRDNVTIEIVLHEQASFLDRALLQNIDSLIFDHEMGHYNITALYGRDLFIDIMQLKAQTFRTEAEGQSEIGTFLSQYLTGVKKAHKEYDEQTKHGEPTHPSIGPPNIKNSNQEKWETLIDRAFKTERSPPVHAPDDTMYKVRLIDVLKSAGVI